MKKTLLLIILLFSNLIYSQTVTVSGGSTYGVEGTYNYAGITNIDGNDRAYFDLPSSSMRIEYRDGGHGNEWEIWESLAGGGAGTVRYYNVSSAITPPNGTWQPDVAAGTVTVTYVLPVELTSFSGSVVENKVVLNWATATEVNNYGFEIQKSEDRTQNSEWTKIGFVQGNGTTNSPKTYEFTDDLALNPNLTRLDYRLKQIDNDGAFEYSKVVTVDLSNITSVDDEMNYEFSLEQNYPNPFNPTTTIKYQVASIENVKLIVYNSLGQQVAILVNEQKAPGNYEVQFDGNNLSSGMYFYKLTSGEFVQIKKLMLLK